VSEPSTSSSPSQRHAPPRSTHPSIADVVQDLAADGWRERFAPLEGGEVRCPSCGAELPASDLPTEGLRRVDGATDPSDVAVVVPVTCPTCTTRGVVVVRSGLDGGPEDTDVVAALDHGERQSG
jgi:hypothetical protein